MDRIININGVQTILPKSKVETYEELISICDMRIFHIEEIMYEISANEKLIKSVFEKRVQVYKNIINRLSQRIITLKSNDTTLTRQKV